MVGKGKKRKEVWKWGKESIEEVQEFKYLGFTLSRRGDYEEHIRELGRKGRIAARKVWGLGESCVEMILREDGYCSSIWFKVS